MALRSRPDGHDAAHTYEVPARPGEPVAAGGAADRETRMRALRVVYEVHLRGVYRYLYQRVGNREEAEDLTSQVFVKAARELDLARSEHEIGAWLLRVARTTVADHWRQLYAVRTASLEALCASGWEPATAVSPRAAAAQTEARVAAVLGRLPARARDVLQYRFLRGFSLEETAAAMCISVANVKVSQFRALRLAARLAETLD